MCVNIFQVYEYITYDANKHISLASLPGMQERTIITSSLSKTYSVTGEHNSEFAAQFVVTQPTIEIATFCDLWDDTWQINCLDWLGWRLGWACAAASIASAIRNIHIKLTDSAPAPFQEAALIALTSTADYYTSLKKVSFNSNHASFRLSCLTLQFWWLWLGLWGEKRLHPSVTERLWLQNQLQATRFSICVCWAAKVLSTFRCEFLQWEIELHLKHFALCSGTQMRPFFLSLNMKLWIC